MTDPVSGVFTREQLRELAAAPGFGSAAKIIRRHDPMWGRKDGEEIKWLVTFTRQVTENGHAYVRASSKEDAEKLAADLDSKNINWCADYADEEYGDIEAVPAKDQS
jgi:hypothetical protein